MLPSQVLPPEYISVVVEEFKIAVGLWCWSSIAEYISKVASTVFLTLIGDATLTSLFFFLFCFGRLGGLQTFLPAIALL
jgi:hypothetical protein